MNRMALVSNESEYGMQIKQKGMRKQTFQERFNHYAAKVNRKGNVESCYGDIIKV